MEKGKHFEVWNINTEVLAKGEFLDSKRVIITEETNSDKKPMKEYDTLRAVREDYEAAFCIHVPKQGSVEDLDDMDFNIVIPADNIDLNEIFKEQTKNV